jgi:hypothetical protein
MSKVSPPKVHITQDEADRALAHLKRVANPNGWVGVEEAASVCKASSRPVAQVIAADPDGSDDPWDAWTGLVHVSDLEHALNKAASEGYSLPEMPNP